MKATRRAALALLTTALAAASFSAAADTLTMTGSAWGHQLVKTSLTGWEYAGEYTANFNGQNFLTYCTDIYQPFNFNIGYNEYHLADTGTAGGFTQRQANLIANMYAMEDNGRTAKVDTTDEAAAFQLAVWEIMTETSSTLSVGTGADQGLFYVEEGATAHQIELANQYLKDAQTTDQGTFTVTRLHSPDHQDMVIVQDVSAVPEPSTYAMILAGLAVMGTVAKRRKPAR